MSAAARACTRGDTRVGGLAFARHLDWCRQRNLRASYIDTRRRAVTNVEADIGMALEDADEDTLLVWYERVTERMTPESRAVLLSHVVNFFRWLVRERYRDDDPTVRLVRPRVGRRLPRPIADNDLAVALAAAPGRVRPWLYLAAFQGLRACEIARLRGEDIDYDRTILVVNDGKGGKQRVLPLHPEVGPVLRYADLPSRGFVFPHWDRPGPVKPHNVSHACNRYLHQLGIVATLHQLRHWFGTGIYKVSHDLRLTQELMGHADPATTAGYAAWEVDKSAPAVIGLRVAVPGS